MNLQRQRVCLWSHFGLEWVFYTLAYFICVTTICVVNLKNFEYITWILIARVVYWNEALKRNPLYNKITSSKTTKTNASWLQLMKSSWIAFEELSKFSKTFALQETRKSLKRKYTIFVAGNWYQIADTLIFILMTFISLSEIKLSTIWTISKKLGSNRSCLI